MSALALVISLGGASYAAVTVGSAQIKDNSVASKDIKNRTIATKDLSRKTSARLVTKGSPAGGALTGTYPAPRIAAAARPTAVASNPGQASNPCPAQTLVLCGTTGNFWAAGGFGIAGPAVWIDQLGQVHLRGTLRKVGSPDDFLFRLPAGMRPRVFVSEQVALGEAAGAGSSALLVIDPDGFVGLYQRGSAQSVVHLGDITFRTDA